MFWCAVDEVFEEAGGGGEEIALDAYESAHSPPAEEGLGTHFQEEEEKKEEEADASDLLLPSSWPSSTAALACAHCWFPW